MDKLFALITLIYSTFLMLVRHGALALGQRTAAKPEPSAFQPISVIIPARNEQTKLLLLLESLARLDYPSESYELILINDHSQDGSAQFLATQTICPKLRVIDFYDELPGLIGKKAALQKGIEAAKYDLLAFSDADCILPSTWLQEINRAADPETDYLLSYSVMRRTPSGSTLRLKNFERSVYYALAAAGLYFRIPITSSACNMVYRKELFYKSRGFSGIGHLASGADDLLLMKMMPNIRKAAYNPSPSMQVCSVDGSSASQHFHTNIRRASKFKHHPWWVKALSAFIFLYFCLFYANLPRLCSGKAGTLLKASLLIKTSAEITLVISHLKLIKRPYLGVLYPLQILIFPLQFIFYALRGSLGSYRWK
ncbi:MAG: glycosyltransferase [Candidatus Cloacimonetes bacterium]|nr:glycosyltransferase [Candidatus Cloacimonadota bacterium]